MVTSCPLHDPLAVVAEHGYVAGARGERAVNDECHLDGSSRQAHVLDGKPVAGNDHVTLTAHSTSLTAR